MGTRRDSLYEVLQNLPKCQLHLHLDGSLSFEFICKSFERMKVNEPARVQDVFPRDWEPGSPEDLRNFLLAMKKGSIKTGMVMKPCANWEVFDFCNNFLQTAVDLCDATCDLVTRLYEQHSVNYIEVRFAPILHTKCGLTLKQVVESVIKGFTNAQSLHSGIYGGIILCALRSYPIEDAKSLVPLIESYPEVVGFDIAGDEKTYPLSLFSDVINECKSKQIKITVHAGEWPDSLHNVDVASDLLVNRIGHAISLKSAPPNLFDAIRSRNIAIEVNLTANCANPLKVATFSDHPFPKMLKENLKIAGLNCDNLLLSGNETLGAPDPTGECVRALLDCKVSPQQLYRSILEGYDAGFADADHAKSAFVNSWKIILPQISNVMLFVIVE